MTNGIYYGQSLFLTIKKLSDLLEILHGFFIHLEQKLMNGYTALKALSHPELLMSCTTESFTQSVGTWASSLFGEQTRHAHLRLLHQLFPLLRKMCSYSGKRLTSPVRLSSGLY